MVSREVISDCLAATLHWTTGSLCSTVSGRGGTKDDCNLGHERHEGHAWARGTTNGKLHGDGGHQPDAGNSPHLLHYWKSGPVSGHPGLIGCPGITRPNPEGTVYADAAFGCLAGNGNAYARKQDKGEGQGDQAPEFFRHLTLPSSAPRSAPRNRQATSHSAGKQRILVFVRISP